MRQQTSILNVSRFHPNMHSAILSNHFSTAFSPIPRSLSEAGKRGTKLTFWSDPYACDGISDNKEIKLSIRIDLYESARKIILSYRTALVAMPLGMVSIAFAFQIHRYRASGHFPPFAVAISTLIDNYLFKSLVIIVGLQFLQSIILNASIGQQPNLSPHAFLASLPT